MSPELKEGIIVGFCIGLAPALLRLLMDYILDFLYPFPPRSHGPQKFDVHRDNVRLNTERNIADKLGRIMDNVVAQNRAIELSRLARKYHVIEPIGSDFDRTGNGVGEKG